MRISEYTTEYLRCCRVEKGNCIGTVEKKKDCLNKIIRNTNDISVSEINQYSILNLKEKFIDDGLSDSRMASIISTLKDFLKYLKEFVELDGIYDYTTITIPRVKSKKPEYMLQEEVDEFMEILPEETLKDKRFKALVAVLACSGARISEILDLSADAVDYAQGEITVCGKGHHFRKIYIDERAKYYLRLYENAKN